MFFLGVFAVIQVTFLPGILLLKIFPTRWRLIPTGVYAFGLSLVANYALVLILTSVHLYTRGVMLALFLIEVVAAVYLYWQTLSQPLNHWAEVSIHAVQGAVAALVPEKDQDEDSSPFWRILLLVLTLALVGYALSVVVWGFKTWLDGFGMVIDRWDAVVSWNDWAEQWAGNHFPLKTWEYPQLLPINLSLAYVFTGSTVMQLFNTAYLGLFMSSILLLLFDLALQHRSAGYFAAIIAAKFILKEFTWEFFHTAYADLPLAFFAFTSAFTILEARQTTDRKQRNGVLWIGMLLAAGAAVTKQGGLFMLVMTPLMASYLVANKEDRASATHRKRLLGWVGGMLLVVLPWYLYVEVGIISGTFESNIEWVTSGIYGNLTYWERFLNAFNSLGIYGYSLILLFLGGFWLEKPYRWMVYGIVLPYSLIWAVFFGYDPRNLSLVFGFWGLGLGMLLETILGWGKKVVDGLKLGRVPALVLPVLLVAGIAAGSLLLTDEKLTNQQLEAQRHILDDRLNNFLYQYFDDLGHIEPILTSYPVERLPGLEGIKVSFSEGVESFYQQWEAYPEVDLILVPGSAESELLNHIMDKVDTGEYELLFYENNFRYYFIRRNTP